MKSTRLLVVAVLILLGAVVAQADEVTLYSQSISNVGPAPTGQLYFVLDLCAGQPAQLAQCILDPLATFVSTGSAIFTASDPNFQTFVSYLTNPNPGNEYVYPFFAYEDYAGSTSTVTAGNFYVGHFDNYPGGPVTPLNPDVEAVEISVDPIAGFQESSGAWTAQTPSGSQAYVNYDIEGLRLVPEPATLVLLALGLMALLVEARNRDARIANRRLVCR